MENWTTTVIATIVLSITAFISGFLFCLWRDREKIQRLIDESNMIDAMMKSLNADVRDAIEKKN
jgi:hypothetical protein